MGYSTEDVLRDLQTLGVSPKKSLGQNFLVNKETCSRIVEESLKSSPDKIIEIGPGLGALTHLLIESKVNLTLLELDKKFSEYWQKERQKVLEGDALKQDWNELTNGKKTVLVSNLPYQISSRLIIDRTVDETPIDKMILMFQKEVAQRIVASHGSKDYGLLSVMAQSGWKITKLLDAGPKDFYPPPQIASRVLVFERIMQDPKLFTGMLKVLKLVFGQRRKMAARLLKPLFFSDSIENAFSTLKIDKSTRAENISVTQYLQLTQMLLT